MSANTPHSPPWNLIEYFGKLVEGKKAQEQRIQDNQTNESDQGQCRINEEGELEGYCGVGGLGGSGGTNFGTTRGVSAYSQPHASGFGREALGGYDL